MVQFHLHLCIWYFWNCDCMKQNYYHSLNNIWGCVWLPEPEIMFNLNFSLLIVRSLTGLWLCFLQPYLNLNFTGQNWWLCSVELQKRWVVDPSLAQLSSLPASNRPHWLHTIAKRQPLSPHYNWPCLSLPTAFTLSAPAQALPSLPSPIM